MTATQLEEVLEKADPGVSGVYVVKAITQSKTGDGKEWFKMHWQGYSKSASTWRPVEHLVEWGASAMVAEFRASQKPYLVRQLHCDEVTLAVMELMQRHHLTRSVEFYGIVQRYKKEFDGVQDKRLQELHGKEYQDVLCSRQSVPLQIKVLG